MSLINPELFAGYLVATTALVLLPGPIVTLVVANSVAYGTRTGLATVAGTSSGNALLVAAGALGLGAVLAVLADLVHWIRWVGVAYLVYLGLKEWRLVFRRSADGVVAPMPASRGVFWQGVLVALTNPKTIFFYLAFFPQFLDAALPAGPQLLLMSVAFVLIAVLLDSGYAMLAGRLRPALMNARRARLRHGITGTLLLGTGLGLALARREG